MIAAWLIALLPAAVGFAIVAWVVVRIARTDTPPRIPERGSGVQGPFDCTERGPCPCYEGVTCQRWRTCDRDPGWQAPGACPFDAYEKGEKA